MNGILAVVVTTSIMVGSGVASQRLSIKSQEEDPWIAGNVGLYSGLSELFRVIFWLSILGVGCALVYSIS